MTRRRTPEADAQRAIVQALRVVLPRGSIVHHAANEITSGDRRAKLRQAILVGMGVHAGFADLIDSGAVDYVQMDILCQGGISSARQIFERIAEQRLRFAFHSWGTALEVLTAAQLGVCWPEDVVEWLEYPCYSHRERPAMYPFPLADEILSEALMIEGGYLILPEGPGLGIDVNEAVIEKYPFIPGPWSIFELDSPAQTVAVTGNHSLKWVRGERND